jgi:hypothetical protein
MKEQIEQDVWKWITDYIEVNHEFYDNKFAPCPFAKRARLKGQVSVVAWQIGSYKKFIQEQLNDLTQSEQTVKVMVFPPSFRYAYLTRYYIKRLNKKIVADDYYIQCGNAIDTDSKYSGLSGNYSVAIINKLSDVLSGHNALKSTTYYDNWTEHHYYNVVGVRQNVKDEYEQTN